MALKDTLGHALYEELRTTIQKAFPGGAHTVDDNLVDAFIAELQRRGLPGLEHLGLPAPAPASAPTTAPSYPVYLGHATHMRVLKMDSTQPFNSAFVGVLPMVRVPLPAVMSGSDAVLDTSLGQVDFARDHLAGSVELVGTLFSAQLGYAPARVDLLTPVRSLGMRFAAIAVYLGYRNASDTEPSCYILEAGLATGQAAMLYLGLTPSTTIVQTSGYIPTPFSSATNTYTGTLTVVNDQPTQLVVQSATGTNSWYIQVTIDFVQASSASNKPLEYLVEATMRVAAIGSAMDVPTGIPAAINKILADLALATLPWLEKPGS